jgi:poly(beta-D-mannuronate) lyase
MKPALIIFVLLTAAPSTLAAVVKVASIDELKRAITSAQFGDRIVVADGKYTADDDIGVRCLGTAKQPIVIEAQTVGGVEIAGRGFRIQDAAGYVVIKGFVFTHENTMYMSGGSHHCRVTRNVFALKIDKGARAPFVTVNSDDNEIDHNIFRDKNTEGQMLFIQGPGEKMAKRNWVHHNLFLNFGKGAPNNASGLHFGSSHRSMDPGYSVAEYNLFIRNVGENEGAICSKTTDAIYRYNTIIDSTELSLRHGHRAQVYGNFMINSSGLRFFAHDHQIYSNYFAQCRPAIAIGNGGATIPPGPLTSHQRPDRVQVVYNTLVDNRANIQMSGRKGGLGADDLVVANNIIQGGNQAVTIAGPLKNPKWEGNIIWQTEGGAGDMPGGGFREIDPRLAKDEHGVWRLGEGSPAIGAGVGANPFVIVDIDRQPRPADKRDVGADQLVKELANARPLTEADVGPNAPAEPDRPLISAPKVQWPAKAAGQ